MPCPVVTATQHLLLSIYFYLFLSDCLSSSLWFVRHYSPSQARHGIGRSIVSRLKWVNEKYERFLQRRFPRFYALYHTFMKGIFKISTGLLNLKPSPEDVL